MMVPMTLDYDPHRCNKCGKSYGLMPHSYLCYWCYWEEMGYKTRLPNTEAKDVRNQK